VTRNPAAVAIVTAAEYLPWVLVAPFAGYFVDRWPKRTTMIVADLLRCMLVALLAALLATGSASIPAIALCAFAMASGNVSHSAAAEATIADLTALEEKRLHAVNGRQQAAYTGGRQLVGPPLGSLTFSAARWLPFAIDAVSFLGSALLLAIIPAQKAPRGRPEGVWGALRASTVYLLRNRDLRMLATLTAMANFSINMVMGILVLYATDPQGLGVTEAEYGLLLAAMAVGGVVGGFIVPWVTGRLGSRTTMIAGLAAQGAAWFLVAATGQALLAGAALALGFVGVTLVSVVVMTTRQKQVPPELLGKVISAFRVVGNGPAPLGAVAGGVLATAAGLQTPIFVAAGVTLLAVVLVLRARVNSGR